jgi:hypothetical protein
MLCNIKVLPRSVIPPATSNDQRPRTRYDASLKIYSYFLTERALSFRSHRDSAAGLSLEYFREIKILIKTDSSSLALFLT